MKTNDEVTPLMVAKCKALKKKEDEDIRKSKAYYREKRNDAA